MPDLCGLPPAINGAGLLPSPCKPWIASATFHLLSVPEGPTQTVFNLPPYQLENSHQSSHCPTPLKPCSLRLHLYSPTLVLAASPPSSIGYLLYIRSTHQPIATSLRSAPMPPSIPLLSLTCHLPTPVFLIDLVLILLSPTPHPMIHLMMHHLIPIVTHSIYVK